MVKNRVVASTKERQPSTYRNLTVISLKICYKKISVKIPKNFVTEGETPSKVFDIGELNLAGSFSGESTDCLN
ncbi:Transthyretin-like family protein [Cooperia oncophora]